MFNADGTISLNNWSGRLQVPTGFLYGIVRPLFQALGYTIRAGNLAPNRG